VNEVGTEGFHACRDMKITHSLGEFLIIIPKKLSSRSSSFEKIKSRMMHPRISQLFLSLGIRSKPIFFKRNYFCPCVVLLLSFLEGCSSSCWQLEFLPFDDLGDVQVEEIAIQDGLDAAGNDGDDVVESFSIVSVDPVDDVEGSVGS